MNIFWFLWEMVISAMEAMLIYYLFMKRIGSHKNGLKPIAGAVIVFTIILLMDIFFVPNTIKMCVYFASCVGYAYLAFGRGRVGRIVWVCVPALIAVIADAREVI